MEEDLKIPLNDGEFVYGTLRGPLSNPLIIFAHGFTGGKDEHIFFNGARFFGKNNISSFRFNFYGEQEDSRQLNDCDIANHISDLETVISYFKKKCSEIIVVGHSFGGLITLLSKKQEFGKAVLWEPADNPKKWLVKDAKYVKELGLYYFDDWGVAYTIGKSMYQQCINLDTEGISSKFRKPLKIISAGNGILKDAAKKYLEQANQPKELTIIEGAGHNFNEDGVEEKLFEETLKFIK
jgi:esterase/lipase